MKKGIFTRFFVFSAIMLILSIVFVEVYITNAVRENSIEGLRKTLSIQADIISGSIPFESRAPLDSLAKQFKERTGARVTIIATDGRVIGDSDKDSSQMENHASRPEIQQAQFTGAGWAIRHSETLNVDFLYVSKKIAHGGVNLGFVRFAVPLADIYGSINTLRLKLIVAVILALLATGLFFLAHTRKIRKLVLQITDFSRALAHGSLNRRLFLEHAGEFGDIADDLNTMSEELEQLVSRCKEETNRLNVILKSIPDALLIISIHGVVESANDTSAEFFGNIPLTGRPFLEVVRDPGFLSLIDEVKRSRCAGFAELKIDFPYERYLSVRVSPLFYNQSELSGFVCLFHDTTQLKRLEETRKDFVANVSHEIKTPVTAIKGFAETLLDGALDDRENANRFLHTIKSHSERLNRLVDDLLTLSKIELGVIKIEKTPVNISDLIDTVIETLKPGAESKGLSLMKSLKADEIEIMANKDRTLQILLNLVDNAIKFAERGGIEIGTDRKGERLFLYVKDAGIGIPKKYLPRLGERFFRVDPSRSRALGGTGLGLAIVKHLVIAQGWEMRIESEEGKGTTVKILIP